MCTLVLVDSVVQEELIMVFLVYGGMVCFAAFLVSCWLEDLDKE
jgi:hypothetical protein